MTAKTVITADGFDRMDSRKIRLIHEASKTGQLHVILFDDALIENLTGARPKFPLSERRYFVENIRYVKQVYRISRLEQLEDIRLLIGCEVDGWSLLRSDQRTAMQAFAEKQGIRHHTISDDSLAGYPRHDYDLSETANKKLIVTGCYDWFHTGHVRFFEEAAEHGDLYVVIGHDKNIEELKGPGHPMFPEDERKYLAGSIRFVKQALISSGDGWLDAEPEIKRIKPDGYVVNEDGDKDVKRQYCRENGIEYIVLKREPKPGLTRRTSTDLRGF